MAVSTDYGATEPRTALGSKGYGSGSANRMGGASSYGLGSMGPSANASRSTSKNPGAFSMARRGASRLDSSNGFRHGANSKSTIIHEVAGPNDTGSIGSNDSRKMIIKKQVDFRIEHDRIRPGDEELGIQSMDGRAI